MKSKRKQNELKGIDTLMLSEYKDKKYVRYEKDFDLDYINEVGKEQCELMAIQEFNTR